MNETLKSSDWCFGLIVEFEKAPKSWPQTVDGAALLAYQCPSRQWTLGFGCCFWWDGRPVKEGDRLEHKDVMRLLAYNVQQAEAYVRKWVTFPLKQWEFDALVSFRFNTRESTLRNSTELLPALLRGDMEHAAVYMTDFVYGSSSLNGLTYQEAMAGLLRRRLCEALTLLGLNWQGAVERRGVALPAQPELKRGPDGPFYRDVIDKAGRTTLDMVLPRARPLTPVATFEMEPVALPAPASAAALAPVASFKVDPKPAPAAKELAPAASPVGTKPKSPASVAITDVPYKVDPTFGAKPMEETERWQASTIQNSAMGMMRVARYGWLGSSVATIATYVEKDPIFSALFIASIGIAGVWVISWARKQWGDFKRHKAEKAATQVMF